MINPLGKLGDLRKLQKQASQMQKALAEEEIVVEQGDVRVVITGDQQIKEFSVAGVSSPQAIETLNKAIKDSQKVAAKKLQDMSGGLSGLLGGGGDN